MADEFDIEIQNTLNKAIQTVLKEDFPLNTFIDQAKKLDKEGSELQPTVNRLTAPQKIVYETAKVVSEQFQINDLKAKLKEAFLSNLSNTQNINADHSSNEDNELITTIKKALAVKNYTINEVAIALQIYLEKQGYNEAQKIADITYQEAIKNKFYTRLTTFMRQGYIFLTELGETIRNSPIIYEVTLNAESESYQQSGYFSLSELMDYTYIEMHRGTFSLRLNKSGVKTSGKMLAWNQNAITAYKGLETLARGVKNLSKMNQGQLVEAFRDAADLIFNKGLQEILGTNPESLITQTDHDIHTYLHSAYKDRTRYYQAGDIVADIDSMFKIFDEISARKAEEQVNSIIGMNNIKNGTVEVQEKTGQATFTTFSGLRTQITKAKESLMKLSNAIDKIKAKTNGVIQGYGKRIENMTKKLVEQFLPKAKI